MENVTVTKRKGHAFPADENRNIRDHSLLAMIAHSAVQLFTQIPIYNAILFINPSTMLLTTKVIG